MNIDYSPGNAYLKPLSGGFFCSVLDFTKDRIKENIWKPHWIVGYAWICWFTNHIFGGGIINR